jgi:asparagine synthase (glutamine-hydrolysing)
MCGILAIHDPAGGVTEAEIRRGLDAMRHRGPDGEGVWVSPDRTVGIGHVRLAVIDPLTGQQPIANEDGTIVAAVNGEFYGYDAIRRNLEARGHVFRTNSDSEILVHLYEEHGDECLSRLRGEFAFVLWDRRRVGFWTYRDRFGVRPLVYHYSGRRAVVASEAKALFAVGVPAGWDPAAMWQVCGMQYPPPVRTPFREVYQLPPGGAMWLTAKLAAWYHYWDLDYPYEWMVRLCPQASAYFPESQAPSLAEQLRGELDTAVRLRLRADVPVCFHLSGGLDTTSVVALAKRYLPDPPVCFTVGFDAPGYDELDQARESAAFLGAELCDIPVSLRDQLDHLSDAVYFSEGLAINGHLSAKYLLARAIRAAGFKVVLSGEGSDETLGGYAHFRQDLLADDPAALAALHAANADMAGIQLPEGDGLPLDAVRERVGFVPTFLQAKATLGRRMRSLLRREFVAEFARVDPYRVFLDSVPTHLIRNWHRVNVSGYLWAKSALANSILRTLGDGTEMAHAVEGRLPFLDHVLFDFTCRVPVGLKIRGGVEKWLLREALKDVLPPAVYARRKHPFTAPPLTRFAPDFLRDHLRAAALRDSPFFDPAAVTRYLDRLACSPEREQIAADPALMLVLTSVLMQQRFGL